MLRCVFILILGVCLCGVVHADPFSETQTQNNNVFFPNVLTFDFTGVPTPVGPGIVDIGATADLNSSSEFLTFDFEGLLSENVFVIGGLQQQPVGDSVSLPLPLLQALAADGTISVTVTPSTAVNNLGPNSLSLTLQYEARAIPEPASLFLFGAAAGVALWRVRRRRNAA